MEDDPGAPSESPSEWMAGVQRSVRALWTDGDGRAWYGRLLRFARHGRAQEPGGPAARDAYGRVANLFIGWRVIRSSWGRRIADCS